MTKRWKQRPPGSTWGDWGEDDELGRINLITREKATGDRWQWCALPIFPAKAFVWLGLFINTASGIKSLADLRGKRVGVPDYVMTAALWFRVFLRELHGIEDYAVLDVFSKTHRVGHHKVWNRPNSSFVAVRQ